MSAHNPILPWMHDCAREVARKHGAAPDSPYAMTVAATIADFAPTDAYQMGVETERARCMNVAFDTVHSKPRPPSHIPTADRLAKLASLRPKLNEMTAPAFEAIESGESAPQPPIYPIAEREPVYPCWLWVESSIADDDWEHCVNAPDYVRYAIYWSPDSPRPPSINPSST